MNQLAQRPYGFWRRPRASPRRGPVRAVQGFAITRSTSAGRLPRLIGNCWRGRSIVAKRHLPGAEFVGNGSLALVIGVVDVLEFDVQIGFYECG